MIKYGGYCDNHGYGYADHIRINNNLDKNFIIRNFNNRPNIHGYFFNIDKMTDDNEIILIGADKKQLKIFIDKGFKINDTFNNCYYISR